VCVCRCCVCLFPRVFRLMKHRNFPSTSRDLFMYNPRLVGRLSSGVERERDGPESLYLAPSSLHLPHVYESQNRPEFCCGFLFLLFMRHRPAPAPKRCGHPSPYRTDGQYTLKTQTFLLLYFFSFFFFVAGIRNDFDGRRQLSLAL
jgi:hypothetical protein